jgi:uncharacterized protein YggE
MNPLTLIQKIIGGGLLTALLAVSIYAGVQKLEARHWHKKYDREAAQHLADNTAWTTAQLRANAIATSAKLARRSNLRPNPKGQRPCAYACSRRC